MMQTKIELLWWSGCPSHGKAKDMLVAEMREVGLDPAILEMRQIVTHAEAEREGFPGSPTIRVNGIDIVSSDEPIEPALTCRLYRKRDGRPSPLPDVAELREALARVQAGREPRVPKSTS